MGNEGAEEVSIEKTAVYEVVRSREDISLLRHNTIIGDPVLVRSKIVFKGEGNILHCDGGVVFEDSSVAFYGNDALSVVLYSKHRQHLKVSLFNRSTFFIGKNSFINRASLQAVASEQKSIFIGDDALIARDVWIRSSDAHPVYSIKDKKQINHGRSVFIGDHVWIGQGSVLLKGSRIGSGSIVGAASVVAGKKIPSNTSWGGSPARQIASDVFFSKKSLHSIAEAEAEDIAIFTKNSFVYKASGKYDPFDELDSIFSSFANASDRLSALRVYLERHAEKNRFALAKSLPKSEEKAEMHGRTHLLSLIKKVMRN